LTLQPASTVHDFSFTLPAPSTPLAPSSFVGLLRSLVLSATQSDRPTSNATSLYPYHDPFSPARPSSSFLGPPGPFPPSSTPNPGVGPGGNSSPPDAPGSTITYHGVCLTVGLMQMQSAVQLSDTHWRQAVLAKNQRRVLLPRASRAYGRTPRTQHTMHVATTSTAGADHGWLVVVPQMAKQIWVPKRTVGLVKAITRWGASDQVITLARARCSFPVTPCFGSRML